jgi:hypothetical protein
VLAGEVQSLVGEQREEPTYVHVPPNAEFIWRGLEMHTLPIHISLLVLFQSHSFAILKYEVLPDNESPMKSGASGLPFTNGKF